MSTKKMKLIQALLYIFTVTILLISCKRTGSPLMAEHVPNKKVKVDTFPRLAPLHTKLNKVASTYKKQKIAKIDKFYRKIWRRNDLSGGFLVAKNGEILYEQYNGLANRKTKEKIDKHTPLHLASVSKVITATAVLKLIDRGRLKLDQKVNTILTEFPYKDITVQMLLNHRSGLPKYSYLCDDEKIWDGSMLTNQDILEIFAKNDISLYFTPDRKFGYCNTNYAMLALIIEKVTDMNYRDAMKKIVFDPLGMKDTYVFDYEKDKETCSLSYKGNNILFDFNHLDDVYGDKNIYSTPRDLLKFDLATYSKDFLSPELAEKVFKGYSYENPGIKNYGLGIRLREWKTGEKMFYHNGWWHGNTSSYITLKKDTVAIIALSNKFSNKPYRVYKLAKEFGSYPLK